MLIIQADAFNRSRINTVIAVVITSNLKLAQAPGNVRLSKRVSGLKKESVVNVSQLITLGSLIFLKLLNFKINIQQMLSRLETFIENIIVEIQKFQKNGRTEGYYARQIIFIRAGRSYYVIQTKRN